MDDFDAPRLVDLRQRRSAKWREYDGDVLPVWIAESDVPLAEPVARALHEAVDRGDTGYAHPDELRETVIAWIGRVYGWRIADDDVLVLPDVMTGVAEVLRVVTGPGDGVVINPPVYPPFAATVTQVGRRVVEVPLTPGADGWSLDVDGLERAFAAGARAYLLCSPHNPVGAVWPADVLADVARLAARYDVTVLADEIHAPLTLPGADHTPYPLVSPEAAGHSVLLTSASKAWNLAGLKCAAAVAGSLRMRDALDRTDPHLRWGVGHLGALAMIAALRDGSDWLNALLAHLDRNRALLAKLLADHLPGVGYRPPQASYLTWLDCRTLGLGPDPAAAFLRSGVALSSGHGFGPPGEGFARLNIATTGALVEEAVRRMARAVDS
jgi:cystathionine beta-lyase